MTGGDCAGGADAFKQRAASRRRHGTRRGPRLQARRGPRSRRCIEYRFDRFRAGSSIMTTDPASVHGAPVRSISTRLRNRIARLGDDDLDPVGRCAAGARRHSVRRGSVAVRISHERVAGRRGLPAQPASGRGLSRHGRRARGRARWCPARSRRVVRCRGYGVRPATQRRTVLTSTWTVSANSSSERPARVIAVRSCSFSTTVCPFPKVRRFAALPV